MERQIVIVKYYLLDVTTPFLLINKKENQNTKIHVMGLRQIDNSYDISLKFILPCLPIPHAILLWLQKLSFLLSFCSLNINLSGRSLGWFYTVRKFGKIIHQ